MVDIVTPGGHGLGRVADIGDIRDYRLSLAPPAVLPTKVDLRSGMPPIGDQGQIGSCTAWSATAAYRYEAMHQGGPDPLPSELFEYYVTRALERSTRSDAGATIRDSVKALAKTGACPEHLWPYEPGKVLRKPPTAAYKAAKPHLALQYEAVPQDGRAIHGVLAAGYPVLIGISVYASFESDAVASSGIVPMPGRGEQLLGGHALCVAGHDDQTQHYTVRNSWGIAFGDRGYVYLPYAYLEDANLAGDFWVVRQVC